VEVSPDGATLTLSGSRVSDGGSGELHEGAGEGGGRRGVEASARPLRLERHWSSWSRALALSPDVDAGAATARLRDGVLEVRLPKVAPAALEEQMAPRRIAVE